MKTIFFKRKQSEKLDLSHVFCIFNIIDNGRMVYKQLADVVKIDVEREFDAEKNYIRLHPEASGGVIAEKISSFSGDNFLKYRNEYLKSYC